MKLLPLLLAADLRALRRWFSSETVGKTAVAVAFALLSALMVVFLYQVSGLFFRNLATFETFGWQTSGYIVQAAIVITLWLGMTSSVAAVGGMFSRTDPSLSYIVTLPVTARQIGFWMITRSVLSALMLLSIIFLPIVTAFMNAFSLPPLAFLPAAMVILLELAVITGSLGSIIAHALIRFLRNGGYYVLTVGFFVFLVATVGILKLIFPPTLLKLYAASPEQFSDMFAALPLNSPYLPTYWMAGALTSLSPAYLLLTISLTVAVFLAALAVTAGGFSVAYQQMSGGRGAPVTPLLSAGFLRSPFPLVKKDLVSVLRSPEEMGYGVFLMSLVVFFFGVLSYATGIERVRASYTDSLILFSYAWMMFFVISLMLRYVFPLIAREGSAAWHLFTQPISRQQILSDTLLFAMTVGMPVAVGSVALWWFLPFARPHLALLTGITLWSVIMITGINSLTGAILPNFAEGDNPERVSTSGIGILSLLVSVMTTAVFIRVLSGLMAGSGGGMTAVWFLGGGLGLLFLLYAGARSQVRSYQF